MFQINGETWNISMVSPNHPKLRRLNGGYTIGACDDTTKTIYINYNLNSRYLQKVLCHEITHAAMFSYNIDITLEQEELLADLIATYGMEIIEITNVIFHRIKKIRET